MITFSTQEELWKGFLYCLVFSFFFGALFGGILAQEKKQYAGNINQAIAKKMIIFGFLALPHWALQFFVGKDKSFYTTVPMPHINAQRVVKKISDLRTQGCE